ncbi:hypothetical protein C8J57DRAFT_1729257 [Mycena rebaudengoi]|nr:hypothetical protein C8J57DRAFT_1729257 [Mycena rebaudengoi]
MIQLSYLMYILSSASILSTLVPPALRCYYAPATPPLGALARSVMREHPIRDFMIALSSSRPSLDSTSTMTVGEYTLHVRQGLGALAEFAGTRIYPTPLEPPPSPCREAWLCVIHPTLVPFYPGTKLPPPSFFRLQPSLPLRTPTPPSCPSTFLLGVCPMGWEDARGTTGSSYTSCPSRTFLEVTPLGWDETCLKGTPSSVASSIPVPSSPPATSSSPRSFWLKYFVKEGAGRCYCALLGVAGIVMVVKALGRRKRGAVLRRMRLARQIHAQPAPLDVPAPAGLRLAVPPVEHRDMRPILALEPAPLPAPAPPVPAVAVEEPPIAAPREQVPEPTVALPLALAHRTIDDNPVLDVDIPAALELADPAPADTAADDDVVPDINIVDAPEFANPAPLLVAAVDADTVPVDIATPPATADPANDAVPNSDIASPVLADLAPLPADAEPSPAKSERVTTPPPAAPVVFALTPTDRVLNTDIAPLELADLAPVKPAGPAYPVDFAQPPADVVLALTAKHAVIPPPARPLLPLAALPQPEVAEPAPRSLAQVPRSDTPPPLNGVATVDPARSSPPQPTTPTPSSAGMRARKAANKPSPAQPRSPAPPNREPLTLADVLPVELAVKREPLSPRVPHANIERYEDGFIGTRDLARTVVIRRPEPAPVAGPSSKTLQRPPLPRRRLSMVLEDQQRQLALFGQDGLGTEAERALVRRQVRERVAIERTQLDISAADVGEALVRDWRARERVAPVVQADRERQLGRYGRGGQVSAADRSVLERHLREKVDIENTVAEIPRAALEDVLVHAGKGKGKV